MEENKIESKEEKNNIELNDNNQKTEVKTSIQNKTYSPLKHMYKIMFLSDPITLMLGIILFPAYIFSSFYLSQFIFGGFITAFIGGFFILFFIDFLWSLIKKSIQKKHKEKLIKNINYLTPVKATVELVRAKVETQVKGKKKNKFGLTIVCKVGKRYIMRFVDMEYSEGMEITVYILKQPAKYFLTEEEYLLLKS